MLSLPVEKEREAEQWLPVSAHCLLGWAGRKLCCSSVTGWAVLPLSEWWDWSLEGFPLGPPTQSQKIRDIGMHLLILTLNSMERALKLIFGCVTNIMCSCTFSVLFLARLHFLSPLICKNISLARDPNQHTSEHPADWKRSESPNRKNGV